MRLIGVLFLCFWAVLPARAEEAATPSPTSEGPALDLDGLEAEAPASPADDPHAPPSQTEAEQSYENRTNPFTTLTQRTAAILNRTTIGGYGEHYFILGSPEERSTFVNQRYILFVYSQITERITTSTEVEFEFAGSPLKREGVLGAGEALLEFCVVDFKFADWLKLRAGVILVPFGALNLRHDSPSQDLTDRPIAYSSVVPSTWYESGAGFFGNLELVGDHQLAYEVYAINGLDSRIFDGTGLRGARGSHLLDNNNDKGLVGRVSWSPFLGYELALSGYTGEYNLSEGRVNMANVDTTLRLGRFELLAEGVVVRIDPGFVEGFAPGSSANTRDPVPEGMRGFYAQANWHFTIPPLWQLFPEDLRRSMLTAVVRYEEKDTDTARTTLAGDEQRLTLGLNFRPTEAYVLKADFQYGSKGERWMNPTPRFVSSVAFLF